MRPIVFAALAALTFGLLGTQSASASAWQDKMLGIPQVSSAANRMWELRTGASRNSDNDEGRNVASRTLDDDEDQARYEDETPAPRAQERRTRRRTVRRERRRSRRANVRRYRGSHSASGVASYYWQPQRVASGGWFNPNALTAAHKTLPFGTRVRVTNLRNGRSVVVRINDRGPYVRGRVIDLSRRAAGVVGMQGSGTAPVSLQVLGR